MKQTLQGFSGFLRSRKQLKKAVITLSVALLSTLQANAQNNALNFDGSDDYVRLPSAINNNISNSITLETWVYIPSGHNFIANSIIGEAFNGDNIVTSTIFLTGSNIVNAGFYDGSIDTWTSISAVIPLNVWTHVAYTYDENNLNLYVNGTLATTLAVTNNLPIGTEEWRIGMRWDNPDFVVGNIDEVRIWNTARTQCEISQNINKELAGNEAGLVAYYNFNQGTAGGNNVAVTTLEDNSANNYDGTLYNFSLTGTASNWVTATHDVANINDNPTTICSGTGVTYTATGGASYAWTNSAGTSLSTSAALTVSSTMDTTYYVTITNGACTIMDSVEVDVNSLPFISAGGDQTVCDGAAVTLSGTSVEAITWNNSVTDGVAFTPAVGSLDYIASVTDVNLCSNTDTVKVTVNPLPVITAQTGDVFACGNATEEFAVDAAGTNTYEWAYSSVNNLVTWTTIDGTYFETEYDTDTMTIHGLIDGDYDNYAVRVKITNTFGCFVYSTPMAITVYDLPEIDAGSDVTVCDGAPVTLTGTSAETITWNNNVTDGVAFTPAVGAVNYVASVSDANCSNTDTVTVTVNALPAVDAGNDISVCDGAEVTLTGTSVETVTWNNNVTDGVAFTQALGSVDYIASVSDANCSNTDTVTVTVNALPAVDAGDDISVCDGSPVVLSATSAETVSWDNNVTDGVLFTPAVGALDYIATVTDANQCSNTDTVNVLVNALPSVTFTISSAEDTLCSTNAAPLTLNGAPSGGVYSGSAGLMGDEFHAEMAASGVNSITYTYNDGTCENSVTADIFVDVCSGINTVLAQQISVYPNPSADFVNIRLNGQTAAVTLMEISGKLIETQKNADSIVKFNLSGLANGIYLIKVQTETESVVYKVTKQ